MGMMKAHCGQRGNLGALGEDKWKAWELGSSEGGALGDMRFMSSGQEVWLT